MWQVKSVIVYDYHGDQSSQENNGRAGNGPFKIEDGWEPFAVTRDRTPGTSSRIWLRRPAQEVS